MPVPFKRESRSLSKPLSLKKCPRTQLCEKTDKDPWELWGAGMAQWFDSRTRHHIWVEFVVGSRPCSKKFFSGYSGFPLSPKTNTKFQFDLESVPNYSASLGMLED